MNVTN